MFLNMVALYMVSCSAYGHAVGTLSVGVAGVTRYFARENSLPVRETWTDIRFILLFKRGEGFAGLEK